MWQQHEILSAGGWFLYALGMCIVLLLEALPKREAMTSTDLQRLIGMVALGISGGFGVWFLVLPAEIKTGVIVPLIATLPMLILLGVVLARSNHRAWVALLPLGALAGFGYAGILVALIVYAFSIKQEDKLMQGLALVTGIGLVWLLYYQLSVPFMWKFISIGVMGLLFIGIGAALLVNRRADTDIMGVVS